MDPKTVEEFLAALAAVIDGAEGRSLTDDEVTVYEELEKGLARTRKSDEIVKRQAAYKTTATPALLTATSTKDDTLDRAFEHYMRTGKENADLTELRAQGVGTTAGGYTVAPAFLAKIVDRMKAFGGVASVSDEITTDTGATLTFPTLDDTANQGEIAAEGAAGAAGHDLTFGQISLSAYKYTAPGADNTGADPLRVSVELLQDSAFDIAGLVANKLGTRIARKQAVHFVTGTGTSQPQGVIQSSGPSKTFTSATLSTSATMLGELVDAVHSIDPAYRQMGGCAWLFNDATSLANLRKLLDSTGRPLWQPNADAGLNTAPGGLLLGYPVVVDPAFADYGTGNTWGAFGNLTEGYLIRRVKAVTLIVDPYTKAAQGQVCYTVWARADGKVQNPNAFALLKK